MGLWVWRIRCGLRRHLGLGWGRSLNRCFEPFEKEADGGLDAGRSDSVWMVGVIIHRNHNCFLLRIDGTGRLTGTVHSLFVVYL